MSPRPIEFPVEGLSDGVVRLRLLTDADLPAIVDAAQDPEIPRWTTVPHPYGTNDARHFLRTATAGREAGTDLAVLIVDPGDDRLLGAVGLHGIDPATGRCHAGYWVAADARRRGGASRALRLLCGFAFEELDVKRIEVWIDPGNAPSLRVAESVGFVREGLLRSFMPIRGERRDMLVYSLLPGEQSPR
ncbi:MAG: GNAT family N-acetyltransferase [Solirubrobacterales bacterium]